MRSLVVLAVAGMVAPSGFGEAPVALLREGEHHRDDVAENVSRNWWAVVATETGFDLRSVTLSVETMADDDPVHPSGKRVSIPGSAVTEHSVFLVRGVEGLRAGPVRTVFDGVMRMEPGYPIRLADRSYLEVTPLVYTTLFAEGILKEPVDLCCASDDYRLGVRRFTLGADGSRTDKDQTLLSVEDGTWPAIADDRLPEVHWIGDLDRDGVLDYLIDTSSKYSMNKLTLYLSSSAEDGEIVAPVAVFRETGC